MKQTAHISLGGYSFVIDEDALKELENYLDRIQDTASQDVRDELVADIEERLAELFIEKCGRGTVVDISAVRMATAKIGMPEDSSTASSSKTSGQQNTSYGKTDENSGKRKLFRDMDNRVIGGVCSGIANLLDIDPIILRLAAVILFFGFLPFHFRDLSGFILLAYFVLWIVIPAPKTVEQRCQAKGEPLNYDEFKSRAESFKNTVENTAKEMSTAPALRVIGRIVAVCIGAVFVIAGMGIFFSSLVSAFAIPLDFFGFSHLSHLNETSYLISNYMSEPLVRWTGTASLFLMGIGFLYSGIMMMFDIKAPKWHPGLVIFILWVAVTMAFALFTARFSIEFFDIWQWI